MTQYRWGTEAEALELDGEWIIMDAEHFTVTRLNGVAGFIWSNMAQPKTPKELAQQVVQRYQVEQEIAETDLEQFIHSLLDIGLLEQSEV